MNVLTHPRMSYRREGRDTTESVCLTEPLSCLVKGPAAVNSPADDRKTEERWHGRELSTLLGKKKGGKDERAKGAMTLTLPTDPLWIDGYNSECVLLKRRA